MESFLAGRPVIAKSTLPQAVAGRESGVAVAGNASRLSNGADFTPLFGAGEASGAAGNGNQHAAAGGGAAGCAAPRVDLVRDADGSVKWIVVTCGCGERIELECAY